MPSKILFSNSFEATHTREAVLLIFRFEAPDGYSESVYVSLSPAGAAVLHEVLGKELEEYIKKFGNIDLTEWRKNQTPRREGNRPYLS